MNDDAHLLSDDELRSLRQRLLRDWKLGTVDLADYLPKSGGAAIRRTALLALIPIDMSRRWQSSVATAGSSGWLIEDYLERFPEIDRGTVPVEVIAHEYAVRRASGETPSHAEYSRRFPDYEQELVKLLQRVDSGGDCDLLDRTASTPADVEDDQTVDYQPGESTGEVGPIVGRFGDYDLLGEIARGGMGIVYRARQRKANRVVALKMIRSGQLADEQEIHRFQAEAEAAASLDHPGIVPIYDVGEVDGRHFFSMGLVDGQSLRDRIADGPIAPKEAAMIVEAIATAVAYAHERGVIHRDLKPANVLLDSSGVPRVTDFGLAKHLSKDLELTATGQVMGTPYYMPPEQAAPNSGEVSLASDVYSVGAILYCAITGRPPFQASSLVETLKLVVDQPPTPPRQLNPHVDRDIDTICMKCLRKEPEQRYATAQELVEDLGRYMRDEPIRARPISRLERSWRWCRRYPIHAAFAATVAIVVASGITAGVVYQQQRTRQAAALAIKIAQSELDVQNGLERTRNALREIAEELAKPTELNTLIDDMPRWKSQIEICRSRLAEVDKLLAGTAIEQPDRLVASYRAMKAEVDDAARTQEMVEALQRIETADRLVLGSSELERERKYEALETALENGGVTVEMSPTDFASVVAARPEVIREYMIGGLDSWEQIIKDDERVEMRKVRDRLRQILRHADPDPLRSEIRSHDDLGARFPELVGRVKQQGYPLATTRLLAKELPASLRAKFLEEALQWQPRAFDLWVLLAYEFNEQQSTEKAIRAFEMACALRPDARISHLGLVATYSVSGRDEEMARCMELAVRKWPDDPIVRMGWGVQLYSQGQYSAAEVEFERAIELAPGTLQAYELLGRARLAAGKAASAVEPIRTILEQEPDNGVAHELLGRILYQVQAPPEQVVAAFERARELGQNSAENRVLLADSKRRLGQHEEAMAILQGVMKDAPKFAKTYFAMGNLLDEVGNRELAMVALRQCIKLSPDFANAHQSLGALLLRDGYLQEAIASLEKAVELAPEMAAARTNLGEAYRQDGRLDEAKVECLRAIRLAPRHPKAHLTLGNVLLSRGEAEAALTALQTATRLAPKDLKAQYNLGLAYRQTGDVESAAEIWEVLLDQSPGFVPAYQAIATVRMLQKRTEDAVAAYRQGLAQCPEDAGLHNGLGVAYTQRSQFDAATEAFSAAVAIEPSNPQYVYNRGAALRRLGRWEEAEGDLMCLVGDGFVPALLELVQVYRDQGKWPDAMSLIERGRSDLELDSENLDALEALEAEIERWGSLEVEFSKLIADVELVAKVSVEELLEYAQLCMYKGNCAEACAFYEQAFRKRPDAFRSGGVPNPHRLAAARAAAKAALDDEPRVTELSQKACQWLWEAIGDKDPLKTESALLLLHDRYLAPWQNPQRLSKLPDEERVEWERLWRTLRKASADRGPGT